MDNFIAVRSRPEVSYNNDLNSIKYGALTAKEIDALMAIVYKLKRQGGLEVEININEFKKLANISTTTSANKVKTLVTELLRKLANQNFTRSYYRNGDTHTYVVEEFHLLRKFAVVYAEPNELPTGKLPTDYPIVSVVIAVEPEFADLFNHLTVGRFTTFLLEEFTHRLTTKYAKALFLYMKQWRTKGQTRMTMKELAERLDLPKSYKPGTAIQKVFTKRTVSELSAAFPGFAYTVVRKRNGMGGAIEAVNITWTPEHINEDERKLDKGELNDVIYNQQS